MRNLHLLKSAGMVALIAATSAGCSAGRTEGGAKAPGVMASVTAVPPASAGPQATRIVEDMGWRDLPAGTYRVGWLLPLEVVFTVGEGWYAFEDWALLNANYRTAVAFYRVVNLFADPCRWKGNEIDPPIGPTPADLVKAMGRFPKRSPTAGEPVHVAGWAGLAAEWSVPADAVFETCDDGIYTSWSKSNWRADDFGLRFHQAPGQVDRIISLDVHGTRLVIDAAWLPGTTPAEQAELRAIIESLTIRL